MKAVILLAGKGRRFQATFGCMHKALITLKNRSLLSYLMDNLKNAGITEIIPVLGYEGDAVLNEIQRCADNIRIFPVWNLEYETTNNLVSLLKAEQILDGESFILLNGDMVFDYRILGLMMEQKDSAIAVDRKEYPVQLDSPRVMIRDEIIRDLGRHMTIQKAEGYAVGIYFFSGILVEEFFQYSKKLVKEEPQMGFHEPLRNLFPKYNIKPISVQDYCWMDVDEEADITKANEMIEKMFGERV
ncbi:MAG: NTP transferase domain-containing protein [Lachnospiraceae bacterium]|nr:NTP transferase domain-containing protein [Lachnospiraceae bacterium]